VTSSNDDPRPDSPTPFDPNSILDSILKEAESRQREESEARQIASERAHRLNGRMAIRGRLKRVFDRAYAFPREENEQGHKPRPEGYRCWAERLLEVGAVLRECDEAIEGLGLVERLHEATKRKAPTAMRYACALLLLASEGKVNDVMSALEESNRDWEPREWVLWIPFILDYLWYPYPGENGRTLVAKSPEGVSLEETEQAEKAFGWQSLGLSLHDANTVDNNNSQVAGRSLHRDQNSTGQSEETGHTDTPNEDEEELTNRQRSILETMLAAEITSWRRRETRASLVRRINRTHHAGTYGRDFAALVKRGLLESLEGPQGGVWINSRNKAEVTRLLAAD